MNTNQWNVHSNLVKFTKMSLIQKTISFILYAGHSGKQVWPSNNIQAAIKFNLLQCLQSWTFACLNRWHLHLLSMKKMFNNGEILYSELVLTHSEDQKFHLLHMLLSKFLWWSHHVRMRVHFVILWWMWKIHVLNGLTTVRCHAVIWNQSMKV